MRSVSSSVVVAIVVGLISVGSTMAISQTSDGLSIADNDGIYIDGKTFRILPGKAKGEISSQIKGLYAQELGSSAIIFRSGDKLFIADTIAPVYAQDMSDRHRVYGQDMSDRHRVYGTDADDRDRAYAQDMSDRHRVYSQDMSDRHRVYGQDMSDRHRVYGTDTDDRDRAYAQDMSDRHRVYSQDMSDRHRVYGTDTDDRDRAYAQDMSDRHRVYVNDPDYVQYKLRKAFEEYWTPVAAN